MYGCLFQSLRCVKINHHILLKSDKIKPSSLSKVQSILRVDIIKTGYKLSWEISLLYLSMRFLCTSIHYQLIINITVSNKAALSFEQSHNGSTIVILGLEEAPDGREKEYVVWVRAFVCAMAHSTHDKPASQCRCSPQTCYIITTLPLSLFLLLTLLISLSLSPSRPSPSRPHTHTRARAHALSLSLYTHTHTHTHTHISFFVLKTHSSLTLSHTLALIFSHADANAANPRSRFLFGTYIGTRAPGVFIPRSVTPVNLTPRLLCLPSILTSNATATLIKEDFHLLLSPSSVTSEASWTSTGTLQWRTKCYSWYASLRRH
jgi:hypothetical protein